MTAATITLSAAPTAPGRTHALRGRVRVAGRRALELMASGYAPPAETPDYEIWRYCYAMPMY
jgi:hypothetical protein